MAKLIKVDGTIEDIEIPQGSQLDALQQAVGGDIQIVPCNYQGHTMMVCDEEGKLKGKAINDKATEIYGYPYDVIVGDAIIAKEGEID